ncbi:peptidoglycan editing factor PgeF [Amphibacillus sediminis]|uniref:peptidoglycan editing factor PgeF n=1 Tax=Amphibacillus sediminis TaxID=360185 RepID=UPI000833C5AB|nr:peptidoglycan editing factor PgeF [Amphibacillus sediminis]
MEPFQTQEIYYQIQPWIEHTPALIAGITTRCGGVSQAPYQQLNMGLHVNDNPNAVLKNRQRLADKLQIDLDRWVLGEQIHETKINVVTESAIGAGATLAKPPLSGVDGLVTNQKSVLLAAFFADCVPLYFYDPVTEWIGIAHAGWRGTVAGMAARMVDVLVEQGVNPKNLKAAIGPSISQRHYQVNTNVVDKVPTRYRERVVTKQADLNDQYLLDLPKLNELIMLDKGIKHTNLVKTSRCTYQTDRLYSYRRDQGKTGRMLGFIGLR